MKVTYWSDYACPYCYIAETRLAHAIEELGADEPIEVEMRAFELDPYAPSVCAGPTLDRFARKYGLGREQAAARIEGISDMGRAEGLDFNYATTRNTNTFDAHRLTKLAQELGVQGVEEALFKAYFTDNLELADHEVLAQVAQQAGLPAERVAQVLEGDAYADEVRADEREAAAMQVHAVPFFVVDGTYALSGCYPTQEMRQVLARALDEKRALVGSDAAAQAGQACGPEGCTF